MPWNSPQTIGNDSRFYWRKLHGVLTQKSVQGICNRFWSLLA
jgi:hypothetical protein